MTMFIVHDADGNILRTGSCPEEMLSLQAGPNEYLKQGMADDATQIIHNNQLQNKIIDTGKLKSDFQDELRVTRNAMLNSTDWTQLADAPLASAVKLDWQTYRKSLRDLPSYYPHEINLNNVVFPIKPS
jgi:hypothetical protein